MTGLGNMISRIWNSRSSIPGWVVTALKALVSATLLWLLFSRIDVAQFWAVARQADLAWVSVALVAYLAAVILCTWRWQQLLLVQRVKMRFWAVTESFIVALFFNNFLPTNIGGDVMRIRDTAAAAGSSARAAMVVVVDRVVGLIGLVLFAAFAATLTNDLPFGVSWTWIVVGVGVGAIAAMLLIPVGARILQPLKAVTSGVIGNQVDGLIGGLLSFRAAPARLLLTLAASILTQAANIAFYFAVASALGVNVGLADMALIVPISSAIQVLPVSINGFGVREATFTLLFARIGIAGEGALAVSLGATALIMAFSLIGAALYTARRQAPQSDATGLQAPAISST